MNIIEREEMEREYENIGNRNSNLAENDTKNSSASTNPPLLAEYYRRLRRTLRYNRWRSSLSSPSSTSSAESHLYHDILSCLSQLSSFDKLLEESQWRKTAEMEDLKEELRVYREMIEESGYSNNYYYHNKNDMSSRDNNNNPNNNTNPLDYAYYPFQGVGILSRGVSSLPHHSPLYSSNSLHSLSTRCYHLLHFLSHLLSHSTISREFIRKGGMEKVYKYYMYHHYDRKCQGEMVRIVGNIAINGGNSEMWGSKEEEEGENDNDKNDDMMKMMNDVLGTVIDCFQVDNAPIREGAEKRNGNNNNIMSSDGEKDDSAITYSYSEESSLIRLDNDDTQYLPSSTSSSTFAHPFSSSSSFSSPLLLLPHHSNDDNIMDFDCEFSIRNTLKLESLRAITNIKHSLWNRFHEIEWEYRKNINDSNGSGSNDGNSNDAPPHPIYADQIYILYPIGKCINTNGLPSTPFETFETLRKRMNNDDGITPLFPPMSFPSPSPSSPSLPRLDVIFIHGLGGHPLLTWKSSAYLWPRDWLAPSLISSGLTHHEDNNLHDNNNHNNSMCDGGNIVGEGEREVRILSIGYRSFIGKQRAEEGGQWKKKGKVKNDDEMSPCLLSDNSNNIDDNYHDDATTPSLLPSPSSSSSSSLPFHSSSSAISLRADQLLSHLILAGVSSPSPSPSPSLSSSPLPTTIWLTHSMGGLLLKQMLYKTFHYSTISSIHRRPTFHRILSSTHGIIFLSTPHFGAILPENPNYSYIIDYIFETSREVKELRVKHDNLTQLNEEIEKIFLKYPHIHILSVGESLLTPIEILSSNTYYSYIPTQFHMTVVPEYSSNPQFTSLPLGQWEHKAVRKHHFNISKPEGKGDEVMRMVEKWIEERAGMGKEGEPAGKDEDEDDDEGKKEEGRI